MPFPWPQRLILGAMVAGIVVRFTGQSISDFPAISGPMIVISGVLMMASALGFAAVAGKALVGGSAKRGAIERWLFMGIAWLVAASAVQLAISVRMAAERSVIAYGSWDQALVQAGLFGFLGCFIFGVSTRTVTGFLGLRPMNRRLEQVAFILFNAGVAWSVISGIEQASTGWLASAQLLVAAGVAIFAIALRVLEPSAAQRRPMPGAYMRYAWFIRAAYAWLMVFAVLYALEGIEAATGTSFMPAGDARPTLHVLTLGFVTSMIMGMGSRMIPLFEGAVIRGHRLLDMAWVMLMGSVLLRVLFGFLQPGADQWLAVSGVLGLTAICLFAWCIFGAVTTGARESYRQAAAEFGRVRWQSAH